MAQLLCSLLLFILIGAYSCMALTEMPIPAAGERARRGAKENWPGVYPQSIVTIGGVYDHLANGVFTADATYNDRPVYKNGDWSIYYRIAGYWVLDFDDVDEEWSGTVAIQDNLFATDV